MRLKVKPIAHSHNYAETSKWKVMSYSHDSGECVVHLRCSPPQPSTAAYEASTFRTITLMGPHHEHQLSRLHQS